MADQFYFVDDYIANDYYGYVAEAQVSLNSAFTFTVSGDIADTTGYYITDYIADDYYVSAGQVVTASATLNSQFTQTSTINLTVDVSSNINTAFTSDITAVKTTDAQLDISSAFTQTVTTTKVKEFSSTLNAFYSQLTAVIAFTPKPAPLGRPRNLTTQFSTDVYYDTSRVNYGSGSMRISSNSTIRTNDSNAFVIDVNDEFVFEGWVYIDNPSTSTGDSTYVVVRNQFNLVFDNNDLFVKYFNSGTFTEFARTSRSSYVNKWTHVAFKRSGSTLSFWLDGVQQDSTTYSGTLLAFGNDSNVRFQNANSDSVNFDSFVFTKNYSDISGLTTPPYNNYDNSLFYYDFEGATTFKNDKLEAYLLTDNPTLTTNVTQTVSAIITASGNTTLDSQTTLSCVAGKIQSFESSFECVITTSIDVNRLRFANANLNLIANASIDIKRIRESSSNFNIEFNTSSQIDRLRGLSSTSLNSVYNQNADAIVIADINSIQNSAFTQTVEAVKLKNASSDLESEFIHEAIVNITTDVFSTQSSEFTKTVTIGYLRNAECLFDSIVTDVIIVARIARTVLPYDVNFELSVDTTKIPFIDVNFDSETSLEITGNRLRKAEITNNSIFELSALVGKKQLAQSNQSLQFNIVINPSIDVIIESDLNLEFTQNITGNLIVNIEKELNVVSNITTASTALYSSISNLNSLFNTNIFVTKQVNSSSVLNILFEISSLGRVLNLGEFVYIIPNELRTHTINVENRNYNIPFENRTHSIRS